MTTSPDALAAAGSRAPADTLGEQSAGAHFEALDGYRALAALLVVSTHVAFNTGVVASGGTWGHVLARFDFGVPLFFLMSGFLLYRPWVRASLEGRPPPRLRRYAVRRAGRILPLYWVVVIATLALLPEIQPVATSQWWIHLLALQIYTPEGAIEGLTQTWSLVTEISFYVALPLIGSVALGRRTRSLDDAWRRQLVVLGGMVLVALAWNVAVHVTSALPDWTGTWLPAYLDWFAAGMFLSVVEVRSRLGAPPATVRVLQSLARDQWTAVVLAVAVFLVSVTPVGGPYDLARPDGWESLGKHWLYLLAAGFLLLPGLLGGSGPVTRGLSAPIPQRLGLISYGIFLWHLVVLRGLLDLLDIPVFSGQAVLVGTLTVLVTIGISSITYRLVERPAQLWAHRF